MITVIICAIIGMAWFLITELREWGFEGFLTIITTLLSGIVGFAVGLLISFALPADLSTEKYSLNIEALQDGNGTNGRFFLGSGHIKDEMHYVFYYEVNGLYRMAQVKSCNVSIKYSEGKPKANVTKIIKTDSWINWFASDSDVGEETYIIEVPKGTIRNNYNLDAN